MFVTLHYFLVNLGVVIPGATGLKKYPEDGKWKICKQAIWLFVGLELEM